MSALGIFAMVIIPMFICASLMLIWTASSKFKAGMLTEQMLLLINIAEHKSTALSSEEIQRLDHAFAQKLLAPHPDAGPIFFEHHHESPPEVEESEKDPTELVELKPQGPHVDGQDSMVDRLMQADLEEAVRTEWTRRSAPSQAPNYPQALGSASYYQGKNEAWLDNGTGSAGGERLTGRHGRGGVGMPFGILGGIEFGRRFSISGFKGPYDSKSAEAHVAEQVHKFAYNAERRYRRSLKWIEMDQKEDRKIQLEQATLRMRLAKAMSLAHMRFGENPDPATPAEKAALKEGRQLLAEVLKVSEALNNASIRIECMKMHLQVCIQDEDVVEARKVLAQLQEERPDDEDLKSDNARQEVAVETLGLGASRECKPCAWYWKPQGCRNGKDCLHCHLCPCDEIKARKKTRHKVLAEKVKSFSALERAMVPGLCRNVRPPPGLAEGGESRMFKSEEDGSNRPFGSDGDDLRLDDTPAYVEVTPIFACDGEDTPDLDLPECVLGALDPPSIGSIYHSVGQCRPCAWFWKNACIDGKECIYCHLCPDRKDSFRTRRQSELEDVEFPASNFWRQQLDGLR
eukprot:symbB.v1.2.003485.t1/scaffold198.1/size278664/1